MTGLLQDHQSCCVDRQLRGLPRAEAAVMPAWSLEAACGSISTTRSTPHLHLHCCHLYRHLHPGRRLYVYIYNPVYTTPTSPSPSLLPLSSSLSGLEAACVFISTTQSTPTPTSPSLSPLSSSLSILISIYLSITYHLSSSTYLSSIYPSIKYHLSIIYLCLLIHLSSTYLSSIFYLAIQFYLSIHVSMYLSSIHLPIIYLSIYLPIHISTYI